MLVALTGGLLTFATWALLSDRGTEAALLFAVTVVVTCPDVERESEHPLAQAVVRHADRLGRQAGPAPDFANVPGHGALATVDGHRVVVGNARLLDREGIDLAELTPAHDRSAAGGRSVVLAAVDGRAVAALAVADAPRPTASAAVAALHELGVRVVMRTGDHAATARRVAGELGIDGVIAEVLPDDKAAKISELRAAGRRVAMVGDGVNDAPALVQADLGVAVGAGTDVALDAADVVLMRCDPQDVAIALRIGRGTLRKMRQNSPGPSATTPSRCPSPPECSSRRSAWCSGPRSPRCRCPGQPARRRQRADAQAAAPAAVRCPFGSDDGQRLGRPRGAGAAVTASGPRSQAQEPGTSTSVGRAACHPRRSSRSRSTTRIRGSSQSLWAL